MKQTPKRSFDVGRTLPVKQAEVAKVQPQTQPSKDVKQKKYTFKRVGLFTLAALLALMLIIGTWDLINISRAAKKSFGSGNVFSLLSPTGAKSSNGRTNILIAGYSVDDPGHGGANLTDSVMLVSLDGAGHKGYMLSIPRDLYVKIPENGYGKINEVYRDGGMKLLEQVVSSDFNVPINYYALVDYAAVRDTVNALGGIWVNIQSSDTRGLFDPNINTHDGGPLKLPNGWQKLDGQTALNLTRARGEPCDCTEPAYGFNQSDFDRTAHQRQVFTSIKNSLGWTLVLNPLKNGKIFDSIGQNVKTDIPLQELRPVFALLRSVPNSQLKSYSLRDLNSKNYLTSYSSYYAGSSLIPAAGLDDYSQIDAALNSL